MRKAAIVAGLVAALSAVFVLPSVATAAPKFRVLVFSKTEGFRHDSIETGVARVKQLGTANNFAVDATEDATAFRPANLRRYQAVVFLSTTGGYLAAFPIMAIFIGWMAERGWTGRTVPAFITLLIAEVICFAMGVGWLSTLPDPTPRP